MSAGRRLHREFLELAAARLDVPLDPADETRLEAHLATCEPCRDRLAAYEADRLALRSLRASPPPPPRDLWARTSAALDREAAGARGARAASRAPRRWIPLRSARGAYAGALAMLVILVVVASGIVPGLIGPGASFVATATPLAVEPGVIAYVSTRNGEVGVYMGRIDSVCPENFEANCQPIDSDVRKVASFANDFVPQQLAVSPDGRQAAISGMSATGGAVYAVRFPDLAESTPHPSQTASIAPTKAPTGSSEPSAPVETEAPTVTLVPGGGQPEAIIDHVIVVGEPPAYSADGTMLAFSAMPVDGSAGPDIYVWRIADQTMDRLTDDEGSIFASWAGSAVVGSRAKPRGSSSELATPVSFVIDPATDETRDLARSAWRPIVDPSGHNVIYWDGTLESARDGLLWQEQKGGLYLSPWSLFDPTGAPIETPRPTAKPTPIPSPRAQPTEVPSASPSQAAGATASAPAPGPVGAATAAPTSELSTEPPTGSPRATAKATAAPKSSPSETPSTETTPATEPVALISGRDYQLDPVIAWEAGWSPDGEWFGAWIGDPRSTTHPQAGSLTVGAVDRATGRMDPERMELDRAPAVRGFALGDHRIAWATVPGADGKSEVRVLVWNDRGRGLLRTTPSGNDSLPAL